METAYRWGIDLINWMQQASPALDIPFILITFTGDQLFYMLFLPLIIWTVDPKIGLRVTVFFLVCGFVNSIAKSIAAAPRPIQFDPSVKTVVKATGGGMPSGHTQNAVLVWGYLYKWLADKRFRTMAIALIVLVPVSRVYLGVHFPTDLVGGFVIGFFLLALVVKFEDLFVRILSQLSFNMQLLLSIAVPFVLLLTASERDPNQILICATLLGGGAGIVLSQRFLNYQVSPELKKKIISYLLGTVILFMLYYGLKILFSELEPEPLFRSVRYALIGLFTVFVAPWMFIKIGLADSKTEQ